MAVLELEATKNELADLVAVASEEEIERDALDDLLYDVELKHFEMAKKVRHLRLPLDA